MRTVLTFHTCFALSSHGLCVVSCSFGSSRRIHGIPTPDSCVIVTHLEFITAIFPPTTLSSSSPFPQFSNTTQKTWKTGKYSSKSQSSWTFSVPVRILFVTVISLEARPLCHSFWWLIFQYFFVLVKNRNVRCLNLTRINCSKAQRTRAVGPKLISKRYFSFYCCFCNEEIKLWTV